MRLFELPAIMGSSGNAGGGHGVGGNGAVGSVIYVLSTFGGIYYGVGACTHLVRVARHVVRRDIDKLRNELIDIESEYEIRRHAREEAELAELPEEA